LNAIKINNPQQPRNGYSFQSSVNLMQPAKVEDKKLPQRTQSAVKRATDKETPKNNFKKDLTAV